MNNQTELFSVKQKAMNIYVEFKIFPDMAGLSHTYWEFDGELTDAKPPILVNSTFLFFNEITKQHGGVYTLSIKTCRGDNCNTSTGRIKLDVLCKYYQ